MVPFSVVVLDVLSQGTAEVPLPDRNQPGQTFFFDGPHEPLSVSVRIGRTRGRENHADPRVPQLTTHLPASFSIALAEQDVRSGPRCLDHRQRPHHLLHERDLGVGRGSKDAHASERQVDDEHRLERDQASEGPDFGREKIGGGDGAPMRVQERLPRNRALRHRGRPAAFNSRRIVVRPTRWPTFASAPWIRV